MEIMFPDLHKEPDETEEEFNFRSFGDIING